MAQATALQDRVQTQLFQAKEVGNLLVTPTGQSANAAYKLGDMLAGKAPTFIAPTAVTAHAGGGQASATPLTQSVNTVGTVATAADSVSLPLAQAGLTVTVFNTSATSMQVFGSGTDTINNVATATGVAQAGGVGAQYFALSSAPAGAWRRIQSS